MQKESSQDENWVLALIYRVLHMCILEKSYFFFFIEFWNKFVSFKYSSLFFFKRTPMLSFRKLRREEGRVGHLEGWAILRQQVKVPF
jgi:hypothetical protein